MKALQEEEDRKYREQLEREEAERKQIEDEKARKKKMKEDKIAAQKAAGTYKTKAEKEKARLAQQRLETMMKSGLKIAAMENSTESGEGNQSASKPIYTNKKKKRGVTGESQVKDEVESDSEDEEEETEKSEDVKDDVAAPAATAAVEEEDEDDWESFVDKTSCVKIDDVSATTAVPIHQSADEDVDLIEQLKREELEKARQLGLLRAQREEEERKIREAEAAMRAEEDRKVREAAMKIENSRKRRVERERVALEARRPEYLRAPISVIMGHVDTGKTSLLDKIRATSVQKGEVGGITQQIGATQFPQETLQKKTEAMRALYPQYQVTIPGLLMIDTPGHESFSNLRSRGSSLCDIAIVVVDLMHGLEQQTIESIRMLERKKTKFVIALNKVDRMYGWKAEENSPFRQSLQRQDENCVMEFKNRLSEVQLQLSQLGFNSKLYWENDDVEDYISLCPTSAVTGEGIPDLLMTLIRYSQEYLVEKLMFYDYLQCTVLEVKTIEGHGATIDAMLVNGRLRRGDRIVFSTLEGPVITTIRNLLTPPPNCESRVKSDYLQHSEVQGAMGVKIVANDLLQALAGTSIMVLQEEDDENDVKSCVQADVDNITKVKCDSQGVTVCASTLGSLEALMQFLQKDCKPPIPVGRTKIGSLDRTDITLASLYHGKNLSEYAVVLAFDVEMDEEIQKLAADENVKIFSADIIYHLFDRFTQFMTELTEKRRQEAMEIAVFPCVLKILPEHIFNKKNPIVMGVEVMDGSLRVGTPLSIPQLNLYVGKVISIEANQKDVQMAKKGTSVSIKIENSQNENIMYGRHFDHKNSLYSALTRRSIDALKEFFKR